MGIGGIGNFPYVIVGGDMTEETINLDKLVREIKDNSILEPNVGYFTTLNYLEKAGVGSYISKMSSADALSVFKRLNKNADIDVYDDDNDVSSASYNTYNDIYIFDFENKKLYFINQDGIEVADENSKKFGLEYIIARNEFGFNKDYSDLYR